MTILTQTSTLEGLAEEELQTLHDMAVELSLDEAFIDLIERILEQRASIAHQLNC